MTQRKKLSEFAGLELDLPKFDLQAPNIDISHQDIDHGDHDIESDDEGAMVKADLFKLAKYSVKLFKKIEDNDQFESWVQAKITKAADYISSVYHYLEYEMKFSEYGDKIEKSDMYSESEKRQMKNALMEARKTLAALKINQADKLEQPKTVKEGIQHTCSACNGTGVVEKQLPASTKNKVEKYNRLLKATYAGHKRKDENENGIPDDEEGVKGRAMDDEIITKKEQPKSRPGSSSESSSSKPKAKSKPKSESSSSESKPKSSVNSQDTGNPYAKKKESKTDESFYEGKPSAGLSSRKKSEVASDARKGKDIGKPGKNFDKVAKSAGGGEKGKKIAAAAMWKNVKESVAYLEEKKAKKDYDKDGKVESEKDEHKGAVDKAIKASKSNKQEKECMGENREFDAIMRNSGLMEMKDDMGYDMSPEEVAAQQKHDAEWSQMSEPMSQGGKPISDKDWKRAQQRMPGLFGPGADERQWAKMDRDMDQAWERHQQWADQLRQDHLRQDRDQYARMQQQPSAQDQDQDAAAKRAYFATHPDEFAKYVAAMQRNQQMMNNPQMAVDQENAARTQEQANQYLEKQKQDQGWFQESTELDRLKMITERVVK